MMLSPIQKEIVETSGNLIVRASAGTGKTHTMVSKIKHDIEENHTHKVVAAITFTIKAATEIKDRLNIDVSEHFIGTNNSFAIEEIIKPFMKDVYCKKVYETICDKKFHPAFNIDGLQRIAITFHSSKGLEFDQVILFVSDYTLETDQDICNHYVAATRAKSKLILVHISGDGRAAIYVKNIKKILAESNLTMRKIATVVDGINGSKQ